MRVAFFVTPVIWMPDQLGTRAYLALYNPFTYFVELIRAPLLGQVPPALTWMLALAVTAVGCLVTWLFFVRFRRRVVYWL
jgi:ABC-type polysaccharide/polyol phosphate export permease